MIDPITLNTITHEYNTPSYIFDENLLLENIENIKKLLPDNTKLCYAIKANPFLAETVSTSVDRLEVCSPGEYEICMRCSIPPDKIIMSGVNKTYESIKSVLSRSMGAGLYTIESPNQYKLFGQVIKNSGITLTQKPRLLLRLSSRNQFGMDISTLTKIYEKAKNDNFATVKGIHYYSGTQKSIKKIAKDILLLNKIKQQLSDKDNFDIELEYGPGLSIPYFLNENIDISSSLKEFSNELVSITAFSDITIELGRYITANCGYYITKIVDIKETYDNNYLIVDGGIHQLNYYGQLMGMKTPHLHLIHNRETPPYKKKSQQYTICGSLCTSNDILVKNVNLSSPQIDDYIIFERCGAYSSTEGIAMFLSRELPQILLIHNNKIELIRELTHINKLNSKQ